MFITQFKMRKVLKEWYIDAPWGKVALVSWGNQAGEPVLLVHGRQDSAATFIPILEYLPDSYYYVAIDLPGHGKSDPFPIGVMLTRFHFVASIDYAIKHLCWDHFVYVGHSMGCEQASNSKGYNKGKEAAETLINDLKNNSNYFYVESVVGGHDVHLTSPAVVSEFVVRFLSRSFKKSKL